MFLRRQEQEPRTDGVADPSKRNFLKLLALSGAGIALSPSLASAERMANALASLRLNESGWIMNPIAAGVWPTRNWWPIFEQRASDLDLPKMHDEWWPAYIYDALYRDAGGSSNIHQQSIGIADTIKRNHPLTVNSAGYCPWLAVAQIMESEPPVYDWEYWYGLRGDDDRDRAKIRTLKEGLLVLKHSGDQLIPIPTFASTLRYAMEKAWPIVVDLPANLGSGDWFRPVIGIREDGRQVKVPDFNGSFVNLDTSGIAEAYQINRSAPNVSFAPIMQRSALYSDFWRYRGLNRAFIDRAVYEGVVTT